MILETKTFLGAVGKINEELYDSLSFQELLRMQNISSEKSPHSRTLEESLAYLVGKI